MLVNKWVRKPLGVSNAFWGHTVIKGNFGFLPTFKKVSFLINFLWWLEGQLTCPRELCDISTLFWRHCRNWAKMLYSESQAFPFSSVIQFSRSPGFFFFIKLVRHHAYDTKQTWSLLTWCFWLDGEEAINQIITWMCYFKSEKCRGGWEVWALWRYVYNGKVI